MNPWNLSASDLLIWGLVLHLIADWPLQNDWMANNKAKRWVTREGHDSILIGEVGVEKGVLRDSQMRPTTKWWLRHPAAYVHASIHGFLLSFVFGWAAFPLALIHLVIDTRAPVVWWSKLVRQTQPAGRYVETYPQNSKDLELLYDVGLEVRFWTDQVFHIACIAVAALLVTL